MGDTDTGLSSLSPYSAIEYTPNTPNGIMYYPEIYGDDNDTSSYFSANSSAYNTPQSMASNAHGLLAKYNQSKRSSNKSKKAPNLMNSKSRSTSIRRHNKDNDGRPKLKPRDNSRANKSHSHSKQDRKASIH